ncbi:hypothetical protein G9A89_019831 [Geosiphon pyriformis]|nr:hypothetical protein G9A89_019831 [Geosiphon pyriformis]
MIKIIPWNQNLRGFKPFLTHQRNSSIFYKWHNHLSFFVKSLSSKLSPSSIDNIQSGEHLSKKLQSDKIPIESDSEPATSSKKKNGSKADKKSRVQIVLNESDLAESFIRGTGPGGQKINKTSICVDLKHIPTNIRVRCQQTRSRQENRGIARKLMKEKLDQYYNGDLSKSAMKREKIKKREAKRKSRSKAKYGEKGVRKTKDVNLEAKNNATYKNQSNFQQDFSDSDDDNKEALDEKANLLPHN